MKTLEQYLAEMDDGELDEVSAKNRKWADDIMKARKEVEKDMKRGGITHTYNHEDGWKEAKK